MGSAAHFAWHAMSIHTRSLPTESAEHPGAWRLFLELPQIWELTRTFAWRDIRVRYKHSVLGIGWAVLQPASMAFLFSFVMARATNWEGLRGVEMPYALYALTGLVPWTFFAASLNACTNSLVVNRSLVTKIYFPREAFPLACVAAGLFDFAVAAAVLFLFFSLTGHWDLRITPALLLIPAVLLIQITFTIGLGLVAAMSNLFFRDVKQLVGIGTQLWMIVSGVIVPFPNEGYGLGLFLSANPMTPIMNAYRDCLVFGRIPDMEPLVYSATIAVMTLAGGWTLFRRAASRFAECI